MIPPDPAIAGKGAGLSGLKEAATSRMPVIAVSAEARSCQVGVPGMSLLWECVRTIKRLPTYVLGPLQRLCDEGSRSV